MRSARHLIRAILLTICGACATPRVTEQALVPPDVSPATPRTGGVVLKLDASQIEPMYQQLMAIDLLTVIRVAQADNFDIRQARQQAEAMRGQYQSAVGSAFPAIVPTVFFEDFHGARRATRGSIVNSDFRTFVSAVGVDWVINPGQVIYEIIAAQKRLQSSEEQEQAILMDTLRIATLQYYELVLAQARIAADHQAVVEADELVRITEAQLRAGTGVVADELRAQARLAQREQDLAKALNLFYNASLALTLTLHLDATTTLVPGAEEVAALSLVRHDLEIEELLSIALEFRPDLDSVRSLLEAAGADAKATWWGAFGTNFQVGYSYGGITGHANNVVPGTGIPNNLIVNPGSDDGSFSNNPFINGLITEGIGRGSRRLDSSKDKTFSFRDQHRFASGAGWRLSVSALGDTKSASAAERHALLETERKVDEVRAAVVQAAQASKTNQELIQLASQQVTAAEEALRLTQANLVAGTMTTIDVLQAQDDVAQARLSYAEAVVRYNQSQVNLLASLGLLNDQTLHVLPAAEQGEIAQAS